MQSNMNPAPRGGSRGRPHGNLRRDINLLPANEGSEKAARLGTVILFTLLGAALFFVVAIWLPKTRLNALNSRADAAEAQVRALQSSGAQFSGRVSERNALLEMLESLEKSGSDKGAYDLMDQISLACPDGITLHSVKLSPAGADIAGLASDDRLVAQFISNLQAIPAYRTVRLSGANDAGSAGGGVQSRSFSIVAESPPAAPAPQATPTPADGRKGGDGA